MLGRVLDELKRLEHEGYHFEVADGSLELLLRRAAGWTADYFVVESFRVITDHGANADSGRPARRSGVTTEATVKVHVGDRADRGHGRGQRPGQRPRRRPAGRHRCQVPRAGAPSI